MGKWLHLIGQSETRAGSFFFCVVFEPSLLCPSTIHFLTLGRGRERLGLMRGVGVVLERGVSVSCAYGCL